MATHTALNFWMNKLDFSLQHQFKTHKQLTCTMAIQSLPVAFIWSYRGVFIFSTFTAFAKNLQITFMALWKPE